MATGWQTLGEVLGGGGSDEAYMEGRRQRMGDERLGAQTQRALAEAKMARQKQIALEQFEAAAATDPGAMDPTNLILGGMGSDYASVTQGRLRDQEFDNRAMIADPNTAMPDRQYAAQAVQGTPTNFLDPMGQGHYADIRAPEAGVQTTDLGEALIGATQALETNRLREPAGGEQMVQAIDPATGQTIYVPRSEAAGMQPPPRGTSKTPEQIAQEQLAREMVEDIYLQHAGDPMAAQQALSEIFAPQAAQPEPMAEEMPPGIPPGSRLVGHTASGAPVYETPNGQQLVAD